MANTDIFLGSGASLTMIPELDLKIILETTGSTTTKLVANALWSDNVRMVEDLYVGCKVELYNNDVSGTAVHSIHTITANDATSVTITPAHNLTIQDNADFIIIQAYGAPAPTTKTGAIARLSADNWLGLVETATFPTLEVEMKRLNLSLGTSRNWTHQYKGIETAGAAAINLMANHGAWLYYALGQCTQINATFTGSTDLDPVAIHLSPYAAHANNVHYLDIGVTAAAKADSVDLTGHTSTGPIFYRTATDSTFMIPPVANQDNPLHMALLTLPSIGSDGLIDNPIKYTFAESNGENLPSFALEQTLSKLESSTTYNTETGAASESTNFVRIARGNRVSDLTLTANENEEVKMAINTNARTVHTLTQGEAYQARGGNADNTTLFNFGSGANTLAATGENTLEPFFFSSGSFSIFGQQFLKITSLTLTINNGLQDKRFFGIGNKSIKDAIPAQREYEITFTAMITDDKLYEELINQTEETSSDSIDNGLIDITLTKPNEEKIQLQFKNYFLNVANVTIPEDKGPITIEGTVQPRDLHLCEVTTHWILQG
tara:strand:- start:492 stop:2138 length:1647 start_codon:yes stop_codon:yes gene_type:complete